MNPENRRKKKIKRRKPYTLNRLTKRILIPTALAGAISIVGLMLFLSHKMEVAETTDSTIATERQNYYSHPGQSQATNSRDMPVAPSPLARTRTTNRSPE